MMTLVLVQFVYGARARFKSFFLGGPFDSGRKFAHGLKRPKEDIAQRRFFQAALQAGMRFGSWSVISEHFLVLQPTEKFNFAELLRLKTAGRLQQRPER